MFAIPWYVALLEGMPEAFLIIIVGFRLFNLNIELKKAFFVALISASTTFFIRQLPIVFGLHTLLGLFIIVFFAFLLTRLHFWQVLVSVLAGFVVMGIFYSIWTPIFFALFSVDTKVLEEYPWWNITYFFTTAVWVLIFYGLVKKFHFVIFNFNSEDR